MGGFEADGEGGYWESDQIAKWEKKHHTRTYPLYIKPHIEKNGDTYSIKAHAKINIFLKITGFKDGYHTIFSRFMRVHDLYDTITFAPCKCSTFTLEGCNNIPLSSNTVYRAYQVLCEKIPDADISHFFTTHKVIVNKRIPSQAGLGGGSSDAAAFMLLTKELCNLPISTQELANLGSTIGADVPFFIYHYPSANVSGFGEKVEAFHETPLDIEINTPNIACNTARVYKTFKENFLKKIPSNSYLNWNTIDSKTILRTNTDPLILNDLYKAAFFIYPELKKIAKQGWYFSGSGSSFFKIKT